MISLSIILLVVALVLFAVASFSVLTRVNLIAAGLFCTTLALLLSQVHIN